MSTQTIEAKPVDVGLKREMGLVGAMWASETSIIGSGWLFASFGAAVAIGKNAIYAWLIGGVAVIILALVHAELGGMYPVAGGTARFPHLAFGSGAGVSFGFFSWLQAATVAPIECYAIEKYGQYWLDAPKINLWTPAGTATKLGFVVAIVLMAIMTAVNFAAMRMFNKVNSAITWWKVLIPVLAIVIFFFKFHPSNFGNAGGDTTLKGLFGALPASGIIFAYLGFEQADQLAGEIKNPQRNLPWAIIGSILIGTAVYVLLQVVMLGATPSSLLHGGFAGLATSKNSVAAAIASRPFAGLAVAVGLGWLAKILLIDAFVSPYGTGQIYMTSSSRVGYGLARNRYYPSAFTKTDKNGIPWVSLVTSFVFGLVFLLPFPSWYALVGLVTSASVLMYAGAPLALAAFRLRLPEASRPYKVPGGMAVSLIAFIVANLIIYWSGFEVLWKLGVAIILGYILIMMHFSDNPHAPKIDWKRSAWMGVYLLGMGIISWQGVYGPENSGRLHFGWDALVVAAFSVAIFFWAIYSSGSREEIEAAITAQAGGAEDWEAHAAEASGAAETSAA